MIIIVVSSYSSRRRDVVFRADGTEVGNKLPSTRALADMAISFVISLDLSPPVISTRCCYCNNNNNNIMISLKSEISLF